MRKSVMFNLIFLLQTAFIFLNYCKIFFQHAHSLTNRNYAFKKCTRYIFFFSSFIISMTTRIRSFTSVTKTTPIVIVFVSLSFYQYWFSFRLILRACINRKEELKNSHRSKDISSHIVITKSPSSACTVY